MLTNITNEIKKPKILKPLIIINKLGTGRARAEIDKFFELFFYACLIMA